MLSDTNAFKPYEPGWFMSMSGSGMVWQTEEQDGDVCVTLSILAVFHHSSRSIGLAISPEGSFCFVKSAEDVGARERFETLIDSRGLLLKTDPVLVWDVVIRKRTLRRDDDLSGHEGIYRRHVGGNRWVWRFIGDSVDVTVDVEGLEFKCVEVQRIVSQPSADL